MFFIKNMKNQISVTTNEQKIAFNRNKRQKKIKGIQTAGSSSQAKKGEQYFLNP